MAVIAHVVLEGVTREQYDAVRAACGWLEQTPDGGFAHLAWWEGTTNHNMDAWESEEAFGAFGEGRLAKALAEAGVDAVPQVTLYPAHEIFVPEARTITAT